jgi:cytochrome c oxidase subunit 2
VKFLPEIASEYAVKWEWLNVYLHLWIVFFTLLIFVGVFVFAVKYRRRDPDERPKPILGSVPLEILWSVVPFGIGLTMFVWGAALYYEYGNAPANSMEIYVTGKQWMFYAQHPGGQRETNELHVPAGRPVRLIMTSEDVIHSFFVPAFRIKRDLVPGRYTSVWFTATKPGTYNLFCAEYCGSNHSGMGGWVYVLEPAEYEAWLAGGGEGSLADQGEKLFAQFGCSSCHQVVQQGRCPVLTNVFWNSVLLQDGSRVQADESYVRESILNPGAKVVSGFQNIMPSFQGQLSEQNILALIAYVKSLSAGGPGAAGAPPAGQAEGAAGSRPAAGERGDPGNRFRQLRPTQ